MAQKLDIPYDTISKMSVSAQSIFSKCCFCIPLRIGCFILGYMNLVITILQILGQIAVVTYLGLTTHGFDHFDESPADDVTSTPDVQEVDRSALAQVGTFLIMKVIVNGCWLIINIACLVGLHKKRPGPIRIYVGFASAHLVLALAGFIFLLMRENAKPRSIFIQAIDLGLTAYFILVYYIYAVQLERERAAVTDQPAPVNDADIDHGKLEQYIYPIKSDKSQLA